MPFMPLFLNKLCKIHFINAGRYIPLENLAHIILYIGDPYNMIHPGPLYLAVYAATFLTYYKY